MWIKDPSAVLDYTFDWSAWLRDSETITAHDVTVTDGLTLDSDDEADGVVTVWLSGGTAQRTFTITCEVTTSQGRIDQRSQRIAVIER